MIVRLLNAKVKAVGNFQGAPYLTLHISGKYDGQHYEQVHQFSALSKESHMLLQTDMKTINSHFDGGTYLFVDGVLRDYKPSTYKGYQRTDDAIKALTDTLGYTTVNMKEKSDFFKRVRGQNMNGAFLGGHWDSFDLQIPGMDDGGLFTNKLVAGWSPFNKNVIISVDMLRLVCTNGMVGDASALVRQIPIVSDWKDNLNVASRQLKPLMNGIIKDSIEKMGDERATIFDVNRVQDLLMRRHLGEHPDPVIKERVGKLLALTNVQRHLGGFYSAAELNESRNLAHLTRYDVFNILTETSSHLGQDARSDRAISAFLNEYLFGEEKRAKVTQGVIKRSDESDHERAFFSSYKAQ